MTHGEKRELFTISLAKLLLYMHEQGYRPRLARVLDNYRYTPDGAWDASLHPWGLAADVDLFDAEGNYLRHTIQHKEFGQYWEAMGELHTWGGHFDDGNHYSITHNGIK